MITTEKKEERMAKSPASVTDAHCSRLSHGVAPDEQLYSADMESRQLTPIIEVSEREGVFQVHADSRCLRMLKL